MKLTDGNAGDLTLNNPNAKLPENFFLLLWFLVDVLVFYKNRDQRGTATKIVKC